jgi:hypothetical protein
VPVKPRCPTACDARPGVAGVRDARTWPTAYPSPGATRCRAPPRSRRRGPSSAAGIAPRPSRGARAAAAAKRATSPIGANSPAWPATPPPAWAFSSWTSPTTQPRTGHSSVTGAAGRGPGLVRSTKPVAASSRGARASATTSSNGGRRPARTAQPGGCSRRRCTPRPRRARARSAASPVAIATSAPRGVAVGDALAGPQPLVQLHVGRQPAGVAQQVLAPRSPDRPAPGSQRAARSRRSASRPRATSVPGTTVAVAIGLVSDARSNRVASGDRTRPAIRHRGGRGRTPTGRRARPGAPTAAAAAEHTPRGDRLVEEGADRARRARRWRSPR